MTKYPYPCSILYCHRTESRVMHKKNINLNRIEVRVLPVRPPVDGDERPSVWPVWPVWPPPD